MNIVETFELSKQYKDNFAVDHISIAVPSGVKCGFLGKNGAGKTSTIKMLTGLKRPTSGKYKIMGQEQAFGTRNLAVGYLPDVPNFYGYMNATEFLDLCGNLCGIPTQKRKEQIKRLLKQVGLEKVKKRISTYSRGMKQRLGVAQSLINSPSLVFMDEPVSALDPMGRRDVMDIIQDLKDITVVFSTHILADVEETCDYILIIEKGKVLVQESLQGLRERHAENKAYIEFYEESHLEKAKEAAKSVDKFIVDSPNPLELIVASDTLDVTDISQKVGDILGKLNQPFKSFKTHTPTLEEIFYKSIDETKGVAKNA